MFTVPRPVALLHDQVSVLESHLAAVRDGNEEGVHQARVATRRIRELLPLTTDWYRPDAVDALTDAFRQVGRSLGAVRDNDVQSALLRSLEARIPTAVPSLVLLRQQRERRRLPLMRTLIKEFEALDLDQMLKSVQFDAGRARALRRRSSGWDRPLRRAISERAADARQAIVHATGVYFPKRMHQARIAIKKFRYAVEIAAATGLWNPRNVIRELKKGQDVLGQLHDRQQLIDNLPGSEGASAPDSAPAPDPVQIRLVAEVVEAEARDLHQRYLGRRQRLLDTTATANRPVSARRRLWPAAAGAMAASSTLLLLSRRTA